MPMLFRFSEYVFPNPVSLSRGQEFIFPLGLDVVRIVAQIILHQDTGLPVIPQMLIGHDFIEGQSLHHGHVLPFQQAKGSLNGSV